MDKPVVPTYPTSCPRAMDPPPVAMACRWLYVVAKGTPAVFKLTEVIAGWTEGLQLMTEGESRRFWIPKSLAYRGEAGKPEGMLVFDVELVEITKP